jgi:hypothetical protein
VVENDDVAVDLARKVRAFTVASESTPYRATTRRKRRAAAEFVVMAAAG